ncbi:MAG: hypothetical protein ACI9ZM_003951 [Paracoccaceae bacterium]|jgi:hypothetical protein
MRMPISLPAGFRRLGAIGALVFAAMATTGCPAGSSDIARFRVTDEVINSDLQPISATIAGIGNGGRLLPGGGFEPTMFRTMIIAEHNAPDRVIADAKYISRYNTLRSGALDDAEVEIYRITNGAFEIVRRDRVPEGGFQASGWSGILPQGRILPADDPQVDLTWEPWYRPDVPTWFMVRAVDRDGALSPPSAAVEVRSPAGGGKQGRIKRDAPKLTPFGAELTEAEDGPEAPSGLRVDRGPDGTPRLSWRRAEARGVVGYSVYSSDTAPERQNGHYIELEGGAGAPPIRAGDMVILRKTFRDASRKRLHNDRIWAAHAAKQLRSGLLDFWSDEDPHRSWILRDHTPDTPVEGAGRTYLELTLGVGQSAQIGGVNHGGVEQDWYDVLEPRPYRIEVWLRSDRPSRATFSFTGGGNSYRKSIRPITFETGPEWRKASALITPPSVMQNGTGGMALELKGKGVFGIDNFRVYRADAGYLDFTPEEYARLENAARPALRTHAFIKTGVTTYDLEQFTNPGGAASGTRMSNTLPQTLGVLEKAGVDPWLQVEPHFTPEEWLGLVEYLAAPAAPGRPWAEKRLTQGRAAPWTDAFDIIYFEIGNETWNRLFQPWTFSPMADAATGETYGRGEVYGLFQEHVIRSLRASPWWKAAGLDAKVKFVIGGWNRLSYGERAAQRSPNSDFMTVAAYNGGWDENEGPPTRTPASYFNVLNQVSQASIPNARKHADEARSLSRDRGRPLLSGTYEAGPGYALNGLNNARVTKEEAAVQEEVMKSQAAGVATLDSFLAQAAEGYALQNFFTFSEGVRWTSHARWDKGGQAYPQWQLIALLNREGLGDMLQVDMRATPTTDLTKGKLRIAVRNAPLVSAYATRRGDRVNLFVISRRVPGYPDAGDDGCTPTEIELPFRTARSLTLHRMDGVYDATNVRREETRVERLGLTPPADLSRFSLSAAVGAADCGLPPASAFLYVFEGVE